MMFFRDAAAETAAEAVRAIKPGLLNWLGAIVGFCIGWWTGLPPMTQALLIAQSADVLTGTLCAMTGRSPKSESGTLSSAALFMGVVKKGLEWLVVLICYVVGSALEVPGITGAAMAYMMATELVSLMENLELFGLKVPLMDKLLDAAKRRAGEPDDDDQDK